MFFTKTRFLCVLCVSLVFNTSFIDFETKKKKRFLNKVSLFYERHTHL